MRPDEIINIVRSGKTICKVMRNMFYAKGGVEHHKRAEIRGNARAIARLSHQIRKFKGESF